MLSSFVNTLVKQWLVLTPSFVTTDVLTAQKQVNHMIKEPFLLRSNTSGLSCFYRELYRNKSKWLQMILRGEKVKRKLQWTVGGGCKEVMPNHVTICWALLLYTVWDNVPVTILYIVPVFTFKHMLSSHEGIWACAKKRKADVISSFHHPSPDGGSTRVWIHSSDADDSRLHSHPSPWMRVQKAVSCLVSLGAICWACFRPAGASLQKTDDWNDTEKLYACVFWCLCVFDRRYRVEIRLCCVFPELQLGYKKWRCLFILTHC